jgi:hypothetical protein
MKITINEVVEFLQNKRFLTYQVHVACSIIVVDVSIAERNEVFAIALLTEGHSLLSLFFTQGA